MMYPETHYAFCPKCGAAGPSCDEKKLSCPQCGFLRFFNPAIGLAAFIVNEDSEVLLIRRAKPPAQGSLAPPGGFADCGEAAEAALTREVAEETSLHLQDWNYLCSAANEYTYANITYRVIDFFYWIRIEAKQPTQACQAEVAQILWKPLRSVQPEELAFTSMQTAFRKLRSLGPFAASVQGKRAANSDPR
jgi:ADP-ribose pyrophosphatase YjhB (NUDIX family)